jgi:hypothetical protein
MHIRHLLALLAILATTACGTGRKERDLDQAFDLAKARAIGFSKAHAIAKDTLGASGVIPAPAIDDKLTSVPILTDKSPVSWSVVITTGSTPGEYTVAAYGESTTTPLRSEVVAASSGGG